jgi:high-affinity K+ transport system ATPase subunit B
MPGLVFTLIVAASSAGIVMAIIGANPTFAAWNMILLPIPLLIIGVLGLFGRHGATEDEVRFSQRNPWIFRIGGVVIIFIAMKLMRIL